MGTYNNRNSENSNNANNNNNNNNNNKRTRCSTLILTDLKRYRGPISAVLIYLCVYELLFHKVCPVLLITGLPCPGCGMTRAFWYFLTLRWKEAYLMNPSIFIWIPVLLYVCLQRYLFQRKPLRWNYPVILAGIITILIYVIRMFLYYPNQAPLVHYDQNLIHQLLLWIRSIT